MGCAQVKSKQGKALGGGERKNSNENTQSLTTQLERAVRFRGCLAEALWSSADAIRGVVISPIGTRLNGGGVGKGEMVVEAWRFRSLLFEAEMQEYTAPA